MRIELVNHPTMAVDVQRVAHGVDPWADLPDELPDETPMTEDEPEYNFGS